MGSDEPHCHLGSLVEEDLIAKVKGPIAQQKGLLLQQEVDPQQNKSALDGSGSVWVSWKVLVFVASICPPSSECVLTASPPWMCVASYPC